MPLNILQLAQAHWWLKRSLQDRQDLSQQLQKKFREIVGSVFSELSFHPLSFKSDGLQTTDNKPSVVYFIGGESLFKDVFVVLLCLGCQSIKRKIIKMHSKYIAIYLIANNFLKIKLFAITYYINYLL